VKYLLLVCVVVGVVWAQPSSTSSDGVRAWNDVYRVLESPRCMNCHPSGDRPLQGDDSHVHKQNISRRSTAAGVPCKSCHQLHNSEAAGVVGGPPGATGWDLPPEATPMVFQGRTPSQLCEQMKDPARNGHKSFPQLVEHVEHEPLVLWGWSPGGNRSTPPLPHAAFVSAFKTWLDAGAPCP